MSDQPKPTEPLPLGHAFWRGESKHDKCRVMLTSLYTCGKPLAAHLPGPKPPGPSLSLGHAFVLCSRGEGCEMHEGQCAVEGCGQPRAAHRPICVDPDAEPLLREWLAAREAPLRAEIAKFSMLADTRHDELGAEKRAHDLARAEIARLEQEKAAVLAVVQPLLTGRVYDDARDAVAQIAQAYISEKDNAETAERERDEATEKACAVLKLQAAYHSVSEELKEKAKDTQPADAMEVAVFAFSLSAEAAIRAAFQSEEEK